MAHDEVKLINIPWLAANGYGSRYTIYRKIKDGRLPPPDIHDPRPKWRMSTLKKHLRELSEVA